MKKIIDWLKDSNRWKHLIGGACIGLGANSIYCATYAGVGVAGALELKDKLWGGKPDWIDFSLTVAGVAVGYGLRVLILKMIGL
jgi:hypothetical protein